MSSFPKEYSDVLSFFSRIVLDIHHLRSRWENAETTNLLSLLRQFSIRKASDDRDKVYALLGLATEITDAPIIEPDYSVDTVTVFKNTVLGIIKSTGSLSILTGDLGRKNRQDLPSWAVDWSATSEDVDRRRAEDTENYNASAGVAVRVHNSGGDTIVEVSKFLNKLETKLKTEGVKVPPSASRHERFTLLLSSSEWENYLSSGSLASSERSQFDCFLQAVEHYLTIRGDLLWVRELGSILDCPGLYKGQVVGLGDACFSHDDLDTLVQDWAKVIQYYSGTDSSTAVYQSLEEAFLRALCADLAYPGGNASGSKRCRATEEDLQDIVTWILSSGGLSGPTRLWKRCSSRQVATGVCSSVLASIRAATFRRRIFITDTGLVGTGPAGIQRGDTLYLLVGGRAPFILRKSGKCKVPLSSRRQLVTKERNCFELIGDCYVHGLMDGEGMKPWKGVAAKSAERTMEQEKMCVQQQERWKELRQQFAADDSVVEVLKMPEPDSWLLTASGTADTDYSFSITVIKVVERPEFGPWLLRSSGTSERYFVSDLQPHGSFNKLTPGTLLYSLKLPGYHISKWLEEQDMVAWIKDLAILDTYRMIGAFQNSAEKLEDHLHDLENALDDATAALQGSELEIEDRTRVLIV